jgi:2'-5' RNA ligase
MTHRIFIALPISDRLQKEIIQWESSLPDLSVRYLKGRNLHVTLVPPWYTENLSELGALLKDQASKYGRFNISFDTVSFGPNTYQPRLIWATGKASADIFDLRRKLAEAFGQSEGIKPFRTHLTLARFKPEAFSVFPVSRLDEKIDWKEEVDSIVIMESHQSEEGTDYEIIAKAPFK